MVRKSSNSRVAGGSSVAAQLLAFDGQNQGLFRAAIIQSGTFQANKGKHFLYLSFNEDLV